MRLIVRSIIVIILAIIICTWGIIYALFRFRHPNNVHYIAQKIAILHRFMGIRVIRRNPNPYHDSAVYIGNHQNNYDLVTISGQLPKRTVCVGKREVLIVPFFGLLFYVTGNILINRSNRRQAIGAMQKTAEYLKKNNLSLWVFPEGTRSRGRGLLPFKKGAFHTALDAGIPIVPVVCSNLHHKVNLNRKDNGVVICETLSPIDTSGYTKETIDELIAYCHHLMEQKIAELDREVAQMTQ